MLIQALLCRRHIVGNGAIWCNWLSYGKDGIPTPYPNCSLFAPPTSPTMPYPPRLGGPGGVRAGDGWGVSFHSNEWSGRDAEYDQVAAAFRIARLDMSWSSVENASSCGHYDFSAYGLYPLCCSHICEPQSSFHFATVSHRPGRGGASCSWNPAHVHPRLLYSLLRRWTALVCLSESCSVHIYA